ncbi:MAG: urate hydroxylase PuuD [Chiayiivirga sp.]|uniref:urate hydroxylase PuuD n=1 Tax=Chiayiivirga sp. TaxID=2041042 RepID=UPI0025BB313F|nr:urate hydroxylase PuuD [Chiayiivirga sp.]MCI1711347.1 urate hydroxylase PuuD [Chiayiivirga sp.]MCI1727848.1 urate hydroxylase PuuD [Chiayiivirga sp.]
MSGFLLEYAGQLLRWLHVVAAIAWIGESFYFVALDRGLKKPKLGAQGLYGESWSVHGGGFYLKQKFLPAPEQLPEELHWSKWKSYTTWLSGAALFTLVYLGSPALWLIDPNVMALSPRAAVWLAIAFPIVGWLVYDALCRAFAAREALLGALVAVGVVALCYATTQVFAGRAAFLLAGATLATIMSANVFFVIIPGQKRLVGALQQGATPNPLDGARGKQRSVHNTYFTLPVVFAMLSVHFGAAFAHEWNWLILAGFMLAGALIRQFFVLWHSGDRAWGLLALGGLVLIMLGIALAPWPKTATPTAPEAKPGESVELPSQPDTAFVAGLLRTHCLACHSATPTLLPAAPKGTVFDTPQQIEQQAAMIHQQVVQLKIMPPGNLTRMSEAERAAIGRWYEQRGARPR